MSHSSKVYQRDLINVTSTTLRAFRSMHAIWAFACSCACSFALLGSSPDLALRSAAISSPSACFVSAFSSPPSIFRVSVLCSSIFVRLFAFSALSLSIVVNSTCSVISVLVCVSRSCDFSALRVTNVEAGHSIRSRLLLHLLSLFAFRSHTSLGIRTWKSVAILQMDKMVETALPEDLEAASIRSSSQTRWSRNKGGKRSNSRKCGIWCCILSWLLDLLQ